MHGQKKRRKRSMNGEAEIQGHALVWELVSEPQSTTEGRKGLCISVRVAQGTHRELIIEYPFDRTAYFPHRPKITAAIIEADIRRAMEDGWKPESRGRPALFRTPTVLELGQKAAGGLKYLSGQSPPGDRRTESDARQKIATGYASRQAGKGADGDAFFDEMEVELAELDRHIPE